MGLLNLVNKRLQGSLYEHKACRYLKRQGLTLVIKNFRCSMGEIDLIMREAEYLVFIEVRQRKNTQRVSALESIDTYKQQRLRKTAEFYLQSTGLNEQACRFDIVAFDGPQPCWVRDAF